VRVVHVFSALYQGGAENQLELLINESLKSTPDVKHIIISLKSEVTPLWKRLENKGIDISSCYLNSPTDMRGFLNLRRMLSEFSDSSDVVQCWMYHANLFSSLAGWGLGLNLVWNIRRSEIPHGLTGKISKISAFISRISETFIVSNSYSGLNSHSEAGYDKKHARVIPNGFDTSIEMLENSNVERIEGIIDSDFVFGNIGRYAPVKGHQQFFEAIEILEKKLPKIIFNNLKFVFIGRGVLNAPALKMYTSNSSIMAKCVFMGEKEQVLPFLLRFDCFVLPSLSEGFPNSLVEAMIAKKPCISTDVGDVKVIGEGFVLMSKPYSAIELSGNMLTILNKSALERKVLGLTLQKLALDKYSINASWMQYFTLYTKILENK
jgi:glycosyltransferase involved in cell wall biosynthesis